MTSKEFIEAYTKRCSNATVKWNEYSGETSFQPWLTPDQARSAVEIAREETLQEVKEKLLIMLQTSIDNKHFFEQLDDYIEELEQAMKGE